MKRFFYKPYWAYLLADAVTLLLSVVIVLAWFPLSTKIPFQKYDVFAIIFSTIWLMSSYLCRRYLPVRYMRMDKDIRQLIFSAIFTFGCMYGYMWLKSGKHFSIWVLLTIWLVMLVMSLLYLIFKHAYRYALNPEETPSVASERQPQSVLKSPENLSEDDQENLRTSILQFSPEAALRYIEQHVNLYSSNTFTLRSTELYNIQKLQNYRYDTLINFMPLNQIRGVNKLFATVNDKLPDDGVWICCFEPQSVTKRNILTR